MRNLKSLILGLLCSFLIASCSDEEQYRILYSITLDETEINLEAGKTNNIDFSVYPSDISLNFDIEEGNCLLELKRIKDNKEPENYKLVNVEQLFDDNNNPIVGKYRAYFEDQNLKNNYNDDVRLTLTVKTEDGGFFSFSSSGFNIKYTYDEKIKKLLNTGLTLVQIETVNGEEPTCDYVSPPAGCAGAGIKNATKVPGKLIIMKDSNILYNSREYEKGESGMTLKIRGNTSAYYKKKPFKIKLQKKADLLTRNNEQKYKDKDWLLLNYDQLRSLAGFKLNELLNMQWTPSFQFVNLLVNGDYRGIYLLAESVKRNSDCRINVDKTGFIIEYDAYWWNEDVYFVSDWFYPLNYTFKYPDEEEITEEQIAYINNCIDTLEASINEEGSYEEYMDVESWAKWMLAHDILGTNDSWGSNLYITKYDNKDGSKLMMGNLWDFDSNYLMPDSWSNVHTSTGHYFNKLFNNKNDLFKKAYKSIWKGINHDIFMKMNDFLTSFEKSEIAGCIDKSIVLQNERWDTEFPFVSKEIEKSKIWFSSRQKFLDNLISDM